MLELRFEGIEVGPIKLSTEIIRRLPTTQVTAVSFWLLKSRVQPLQYNVIMTSNVFGTLYSVAESF
jgi:hypothetical protein